MIDRLRRLFQSGHEIDISWPIGWGKKRAKKEIAADKSAEPALAAETAPKPSLETSPASEPASIESAPRSIKEEPPAATRTASELEAAAVHHHQGCSSAKAPVSGNENDMLAKLKGSLRRLVSVARLIIAGVRFIKSLPGRIIRLIIACIRFIKSLPDLVISRLGRRFRGKGVVVEIEEVAPEPERPTVEAYPVNEPFAYVAIEEGNPFRYAVREVRLCKGEAELLKELKLRLYEAIDVPLGGLAEAANYLRQKVEEMLEDFHIELPQDSMEKIMYYITRDLTGYGKLDAILKDRSIEDISADGPGISIFVYHRRYGSLETNVKFTREELDAMIYKLAQRSGRHISLARPLLDASLPTKDRLQLSIGDEITTRGSTLTVRKFREKPFTPIDLVTFGTISVEMAAYFWLSVENGFNILFAGGTASGKTSMLNALSMFIPCNSKIVSLEDTREINLLHQNWIPGVTREASAGGHSIEMFDLLKSALRQRPEYLLVGEVRGREAYTLFQAMATGHYTLSTVHADSVGAVVRRLTKPPIDVPLMLLDSLNIIVLLGMVKVGDQRVRRVTGVAEVVDIDFENEALRTNMVFSWRPDEFTFTGESTLFERIMRKLNMNEKQLAAEFSRRISILKFLLGKDVNDFDKICKVFFENCVNPAEVDRKIREGQI